MLGRLPMDFCEKCSNILLPRKKLGDLYCRVCDKSFPVKNSPKSHGAHINKKVQKKKSQQLERRRALKTAVVTESRSKIKSISEDEREAYGELLKMSGG